MQTSASDPLKRATPGLRLPARTERELHRFRNRFELKNIKITGEAASADEVAATFPAELKLLTKETG